MDMQLSNNAVTNLNTVIGHTPQVTNNYSTTEHIVYNPDGTPMTWIDGNIVYEQTFIGTITQAASSNNTLQLVNNSYHIINAGGWFNSGTGNRHYISVVNGSLSGVYGFFYNGAMTTFSSLARTNSPYEVTLRYTKN